MEKTEDKAEVAGKIAELADRVAGKIKEGVVEAISEKVHNKWMAAKIAAGKISRKLDTTGEELIRPYAELSEEAKELDRGSVRATLDGLCEAGFNVVVGGWEASTDLDKMADAIIKYRKQKGLPSSSDLTKTQAGLARKLGELEKAVAAREPSTVTEILADTIVYALGGLRLSMGDGSIQVYLEALIERNATRVFSNPL